MAKYSSTDIRNIVLCGHAQSGKTMLAEAMLFKAGAVSRLGSVNDGATVSDFDADEKARKHSLTTSVMNCEYDNKQFHIIDTPGSPDFIGATVRGIDAADLAVICVNANRGIELMTRKAWDLAEKEGVARMIVISRMDGDDVNLAELLTQIKATFGKQCVAFTINDGEGADLKDIKRVMNEENSGDQLELKRLEITESVVEHDDELMNRYLEGETISHDEVMNVLREAVCDGTVVPVFCLAAEKDLGVEQLMHAIGEWGPDPFHTHRDVVKEDGEEVNYEPSPEGSFKAQVFKVISDPHVGKLSFFRVFSGAIKPGDSMHVSSTGKKEKFAKLLRPQGGKYEEIPEAIAGDIVCTPKIDSLHVGDTICADDFVGNVFHSLPFPDPMCGLAIAPHNRGDEQKLATNMHRLCEEDSTFHFERNELTNEQVVRGIGHLHLDVMLARLKDRYKLEVDTKAPKIPYLETISKNGEGSYRHRKQSGGSGQFGEVHIRLKPNGRGDGFEFVNKIVGGVISGPFIPSVEKGVNKAMEKGILCGYPVVDIICELFDGKEHPVDSKDIAFQLAGEHAFAEVAQQCKPVLLEPIVDIEITFPMEYAGDINGDISTRRGRPTGMEQIGNLQILRAQVPLAEVQDYGSALKAMTQGVGDFTMQLSHYDQVPGNIAQQVIAKAKAANEA